ncbi:glycosyl transferase, group 1 family protein [Leptolyngbya boryana NIES-2135]|jgi:colanic acid/amylovoran biosynthesis glycosyltransferase|uniref:Glycosyl transferase, group 1 family protein n=2 Tax=Leptolyngbya group TaxID=3081713 RepID=A0A1Z4JK41_LEPBY|nr:glycosyltransferase [Leptolyngbya boryana IAM M-101]BAS63078.1 glycosyltransferase [Leptolyngbya boryana dg5]BAY57090.1 glycosyl transferase, group 1 family protein [Leptolyngbya boryana NIES-2135]
MKNDMTKIAYLVNQYPKVSHSFIRREIHGVEASGISVGRYAIRSCHAELVDDEDQKELALTRTVLESGGFTLLKSLAAAIVTRPHQVLQALKLAVKFGRRSDRGVLRHLIYLAEACVLNDWFQADGIQHIHAHFGTNSTTVAMLCTALGGPTYSFTIHGPEEFDMIQSLSIVEKVQRSSFVATVSSFSRSQLYRWCDQSQWDKIKVVHCGVDRSFFTDATPMPSEPRIVCVGRLCEAKGQLLLVEAIKPIVAAGIAIKLVLVGDGPLRPQIEALIAEGNLQDHVEITGWASGETVREHILASRALVLPSFAEGLPVALMEALALHRPVISTYIAGIPELVIPNDCGWLVPAGSIAELTSAIKTAIELPAEVLAQMGQTGAARVLEQHDVAIEAQKLANLFKDMTAKPAVERGLTETRDLIVPLVQSSQ